MDKGAEFSFDKTHRYRLWRIWDKSLPKCLCIGLNPSNANENKDDPTIRNLIKVLTKLGYGGFYMMNCWTYISSKPELIKTNSMNSWNTELLGVTAYECKEVIFCWGNFKIIKDSAKDEELSEMFKNAKCFSKNKNGSPMHPMGFTYQKGAYEKAQLIKF